MRKKVEQIKASWTYRHFQLLVIISMLFGMWLFHLNLNFDWLKSEAVIYKAEAGGIACAPDDMKCLTDIWTTQRAEELYKENETFDKEKYRQRAMLEARDLMLGLLDESPFVDYEELYNQYGY